MAIKVGINGFGRIGRNVLRAGWDDPAIEFVAVNDITDAKTLAHLLKYDSVHGIFDADVSAADQGLKVGDKSVRVYSERDPGKLPWKELGVDVVLECSGHFTERDKAAAHLSAGARKVIISAPAKGADLTICFGVNHTAYKADAHHVISNASCTTNCLAPVAKVLHESFGIKRGWMTTIHSYTNDQRILDLPHEDLRRARAAAMSMIPTTTGAARAVGEVLPALKGKLDGLAVRVPTANVSLVDLVVEFERTTTDKEINDALRTAASSSLKGVLQCVDAPLVSIDFNGSPFSSSVDTALTKIMDGNLAKVFSWYDNEWGFSNRMVDVTKFIAPAK